MSCDAGDVASVVELVEIRLIGRFRPRAMGVLVVFVGLRADEWPTKQKDARTFGIPRRLGWSFGARWPGSHAADVGQVSQVTRCHVFRVSLGTLSDSTGLVV